MHHFANVVLWVYIVLLLAGGMIGFFKAKSQASLISAAIFAALLALTQTGLFAANVARDLANVLLAALLVVFAIRLTKTKKFMPSGMMLALTLLALALRNLFKD
ncbi:MAG TPA: TMEM14 family protein [Candidatus Acidoferrum sp.]|nr:TMEM14 family protein [Candidatus Acidoferrum sp.]